MELTKEQWSEYARVITDLTRKGTLVWEVIDSAEDSISEYRSEFSGHHIHLVRRFVVIRDPIALAIASLNDIRTKKTEVVLSLVDDAGGTLFVFPDVPDLIYLLAAVKAQLANVDGFLSALKQESLTAA